MLPTRLYRFNLRSLTRPVGLFVGAAAWILVFAGGPATCPRAALGQPASPTDRAPTTVHAIPGERLDEAVAMLRRHYSDRDDVEIDVDRGTSQLVLLAPPTEQKRVATWIASWARSDVRQVQYNDGATPVVSQLQLVQQTAPAEASAQIPRKGAEATSAEDREAGSRDGAVPSPPRDELTLTQSGAALQHTDLLRRLGFDVEIEVLPGQDALLLRGRDVDVEAVAEIVREIERVAALAKPQIEVIPLQNASGVSVAGLFEEVRLAFTEGRQGRAMAKAIGSPNAILLIGWGEAFESAKTLIEKLDLKAAPQSQIQAFPLRFAVATQAQTTVQQFFAGRRGLASDVQVVADARSNTLIVHASPRDMAEVELLIRQLDVREGEVFKQVRVFRIQHALAADLVETLRGALSAASGGGTAPNAALELLTITPEGAEKIKAGLLEGVEVTANVQTNTLVVAAPADAMPLLEALIERLDQPVSTSQIKVFRIEHGDANSLVLMLRALLPSEVGSSPRPQLPGAEGETSLAPLRFAIEQRTNSIIATGAAGDLRIVHALLLRLDEDDTQRRRTTVYRLKNAPAADVARAVNDFLSSERQVQQIAPGEESALEQLEREVIVVPEPVSNSLIVAATRRFYEEIIGLVEKLDAQPPQVVIQVLIAQVALNDTDEFGVELGLQDSVLFDRSLLSGLTTTTSTVTESTAAGVVTSTNDVIQSATNTPGFDFVNGSLPNSGSNRALAGAGRVGGQGITTFQVGRVNNDLGFGGLVLSASSESVSMLIRALQESRRLDVLSRPQITTLDNQQAFIQVGQRVPRVVSSTLSSFGQSNSVELENVGLILVVTPRTSPNGMVVMEVDAERSEVGPEIEGIPIATSNNGTIVRAPRIEITTAQTTVTAASGETIVLGGLITQRENNIHRRVPLLADIPLLGDLFRYDLKENRRFELLIILTPQVVLGPQDMERIRQVESSRMHWCAADVQEIHGTNPLYGQPGVPLQDADIPVIYPDANPRGVPNAELPSQ